jgi:pectin methylesterase-like acyl-CoA thioesterase
MSSRSLRVYTRCGVLLVLAAFGCGDETPSTSGTTITAGAGTPSAAGRSGAGADASKAGSGGNAIAGADSAAVSGRAGNVSAGTGVAPAGAGGAGAAGESGAGGVGGRAEPEAGSGGSAGAPAMPASGPLFPANGAKDVCVDAPLQFHLGGQPSVASSGSIRVFEAASSMPVATVDLATAMITTTVAGTMLRQPRPIYAGEDEVIVRLPPKSLSYGKTYYVTVDAGAIKGPDGKSMTFSDPMEWRFTTRQAAPASTTSLRVALDGTGEFCSVQAALDHVPSRGTTPATITIGKGRYFEVLRASAKNDLTLHGEDRKQTVILGTNNDSLNAGTANRALFGIDGSSKLVVENLTIRNLTPQGGSQAEALRMQNCDQCIVRQADILSLQDTLLWSGRIYATDCYIAGNVDFVWGTGSVFFENCEIKTVGRAGYIVQARNDAAKSGYVFVDSKITADSGITGIWLGRIDSSVYPNSQVAYINCQMGNHINPAGWQVTGGGTAGLRFQEYQSTDASGAPLDVSRRLAGSQQLSAAEAERLRNPANVLGGWTPK